MLLHNYLRPVGEWITRGDRYFISELDRIIYQSCRISTKETHSMKSTQVDKNLNNYLLHALFKKNLLELIEVGTDNDHRNS